MIKKIFFFTAAALFLLHAGLFARTDKTTSASDSIDVVHYSITLDTVNTTAQTIKGWTTVRCIPKVSNLNTFTLDLLKLNIDSIKVNGMVSAWTYNDTLIRIYSGTAYNPADTVNITVWYNGSPQKDASGFGGFYITASYTYNIGVGFYAAPHNYGRVWFPCKDNFTDKASYDFYIDTEAGRMAACNGELISVTTNGDGTSRYHWKIDEPISTYLACVAISDYTVIRDTFNGLSAQVPVALYVRPLDSTNMTVQFAKLQQGFDAFENLFGPYKWNKVGYSVVPFNGGAMEHSTNIAYPQILVGFGTAYEYLWAHELSHQWFGDLVTCESQEEMWLNEGFARYAEALFMEAVYDTNTFKNYLRNIHADFIRRGYIDDGTNWYPLNAVPHSHTYGSTVYDKGSLIAHTMRNYVGTDTFFNAIRDYMNNRAYGIANSDTLRDHLKMFSSMDLDAFFDGWVKQGGFPHFDVDSFTVAPNGGQFDVTVYMRQRLKEAPALVNDNRIELTFMDAGWNKAKRWMTFSGSNGVMTFTLPFSPAQVMADADEKMCDATTDHYMILNATGSASFSNTWASVDVQALTDSAWLRMVHNWIAPDQPAQPFPGIVFSNTRYWKVEGLLPSGFHSKATFSYNGRTVTSNGYLDHTWLQNYEDSLMIFWRPGPGSPWQEVNGYTINKGASAVDKVGSITIDTLKLGEYAMGIRDVVNAVFTDAGEELIRVYPNPANENIQIDLNGKTAEWIQILDVQGRTAWTAPKPMDHINLDVSGWKSGIYFVRMAVDGKNLVKRMVVTE